MPLTSHHGSFAKVYWSVVSDPNTKGHLLPIYLNINSAGLRFSLSFLSILVPRMISSIGTTFFFSFPSGFWQAFP